MADRGRSCRKRGSCATSQEKHRERVSPVVWGNDLGRSTTSLRDYFPGAFLFITLASERPNPSTGSPSSPYQKSCYHFLDPSLVLEPSLECTLVCWFRTWNGIDVTAPRYRHPVTELLNHSTSVAWTRDRVARLKILNANPAHSASHLPCVGLSPLDLSHCRGVVTTGFPFCKDKRVLKYTISRRRLIVGITVALGETF